MFLFLFLFDLVQNVALPAATAEQLQLLQEEFFYPFRTIVQSERLFFKFDLAAGFGFT